MQSRTRSASSTARGYCRRIEERVRTEAVMPDWVFHAAKRSNSPTSGVAVMIRYSVPGLSGGRGPTGSSGRVDSGVCGGAARSGDARWNGRAVDSSGNRSLPAATRFGKATERPAASRRLGVILMDPSLAGDVAVNVLATAALGASGGLGSSRGACRIEVGWHANILGSKARSGQPGVCLMPFAGLEVWGPMILACSAALVTAAIVLPASSL